MLKALMLRKKITEKRKALDEVLAKAGELEKREADIAQMIEEAETEEERAAVEEEVKAYEAEKAENDAAKFDIEREVEELEGQLKEEEEKQGEEPPAADLEEAPAEKEERGEATMIKRTKFFGLSIQERDAMIARDEVQNFLGEVRTAIKENRALSNVGLLVPEVFLGLLRENITEYSKLYKHVNVRTVRGEGRMVVMGAIPEAVWTECCANLNELTMGFYGVEVDCNKVAGFFSVCNANLEDSDVDLAAEIITALSQSIGLALDKAILYGTGTKMPLGIVTRLAQTAAPGGYPATARPWEDLHESNIKSIASTVTGVELFRAFLLDSGAAKGKYARGEKVWVMNETTYTTLLANALTVNSNGQVVVAVDGRMPGAGGIVEVLDFIPDNVIIGGYFDLYLLAERAGINVTSSEHFRFLADETVYKGTARYDGTPAIAEAFVAIGINGVTPDATMTFADDTANTVNP